MTRDAILIDLIFLLPVFRRNDNYRPIIDQLLKVLIFSKIIKRELFINLSRLKYFHIPFYLKLEIKINSFNLVLQIPKMNW